MSDTETNTADEARAALTEAIGDLAEVYTSRSEETFSVGWIDALSHRHVRWRSVDKAGRDDGIEVRSLDTVTRVVTGGEYLTRRLKPLMERLTSPPWPEQRLTGPLDDVVMDALTLSLKDGSIATIWMRNTTQYTGRVMKLATDAGTIADLDEYGALDREVPFKVADIVDLDLGCQHQRIVQFLSNRKQCARR